MTTRSPGRYSTSVYGPAPLKARTPSGSGGEPGLDGAEEGQRGSRCEVGRGAREAHGEGVPARDDPACRRPPSGEDFCSPDDVLHVESARRAHGRRERPVDRVRERLPAHGRSVAETKAGSQAERERLEVGGDCRMLDGHLGHELERLRRRAIGVGHEPCAHRVEQRPARCGERERRIDVVEPGLRREADPEDPARLTVRARPGLGRKRARDEHDESELSDPSTAHPAAPSRSASRIEASRTIEDARRSPRPCRGVFASSPTRGGSLDETPAWSRHAPLNFVQSEPRRPSAVSLL